MHQITSRPMAIAALAFYAYAGAAMADGRKSEPLPELKNMFAWTQTDKVAAFSHSAEMVPTESFARAKMSMKLPKASLAVQAKAKGLRYQYGTNADGSVRKNNSVDDYMAHNKVTGLLVLKDGAVVMERYAQGLNEKTLWDSKSVGKSVVSTLLGVAIQDGFIQSLDDPIDKYIPELKNSAYQGIALRHVLQMTSGVGWNENYGDPKADVRAHVGCMVGTTPNCHLNLMKSLARAINPATGSQVSPGVYWNYNSGEAWLTGLVIQRATGKSLSKYLESKVWQTMGMEAGGNWWVDVDGISYGGGGFNATLRDYGRMGLFVLNNGVLPNQSKLLPAHWVEDATNWTKASIIPGTDTGLYGSMWWRGANYEDGKNHPAPIVGKASAPGNIKSELTFMAQGVFGQTIAINQAEKLVVVVWSVWDQADPTCCDAGNPSFTASNPWNEQATFVNALLEALH